MPPDHPFEEQKKRYVRGEYEPEYHLTMKAIRQAIKNCRKGISFERLEGGIIFYKYRETDEQGNLITDPKERVRMKVFVLTENQLANTLHSKKEIKTNPAIAEDILQEITKERPYHSLNHHDWFREHYSGWDHYLMSGIKDTEENVTDKEIFSARNMKEALIIPIPVLSSPSILVYIDHIKLKENFESSHRRPFNKEERILYIREIQRRALEVINFHITRRLHREFAKERTEPAGPLAPLRDIPIEDILDESTLLRKFASNLAHVLLPFCYRINSRAGETIHEENVFNWFESKLDPESSFTLELLNGKYTISYQLPSFWAPYNSHEFEGSFIHLGPEYEIRKLQMKEDFENYFEHIHILWKRIQQQEILVKQAIRKRIMNSPVINPGTIDDFISKNSEMAEYLQKLKNELNDIEQVQVGTLEEKEGMFKTGDDLKMVVKENGFLVPWIFKGVFSGTKEMGAEAGLKMLYSMLKKCCQENKKQVSCMDFIYGETEDTLLPAGHSQKRNNGQGIESEMQSNYNKAVQDLLTEFRGFITLLAADCPDACEVYLDRKKNLNKKMLLSALDEKKPSLEMFDKIAKLQKERNNIYPKTRLCKTDGDCSHDLSKAIREIKLWHDLFTKYYGGGYRTHYTLAQPTYSAALNNANEQLRQPHTKAGGDTEKALNAAVKEIRKRGTAQIFFTNLEKAGFLKEFDSTTGKFKIRRSKDIFYYDQSKVPGADKIAWHFS